MSDESYSSNSSNSDDNNGDCEICGEEAMNYTVSDQEKDTVRLSEWLIISAICSKCMKTGCTWCLSTCHTCRNHGDYSVVVCDKCRAGILTCVTCKYHHWDICMSCYKDNAECGECSANRNYAGRYE